MASINIDSKSANTDTDTRHTKIRPRIITLTPVVKLRGRAPLIHTGVRRMSLRLPVAVADQIRYWAAELGCNTGTALAEVLDTLLAESDLQFTPAAQDGSGDDA